MKDTRIKIRGSAILILLLSSINIALACHGGSEKTGARDPCQEVYLTEAKTWPLLNDDDLTFYFHPETSGWHTFQTYGLPDTVMEIYHKGQSIVNRGGSDDNRGAYENELQHKYLEAHERYVIKISLHNRNLRGTIILNVYAEDPLDKLWDPLTLGYAKKVLLSPTRTPFTTQFTPKESGWYNIETFSDDEGTVMEIHHPDGYSMTPEGESDGDKGVDDDELLRKYFNAGKTYSIQVYMEDPDDEGYVWVHVWRSSRDPITD